MGEGYCESFNGKFRDECLNGEIFYSLKEAQTVIESWRVHYNTKRPHSALGRLRRSQSRRNSTRPKPCNSLSLTLVQKIGQATGTTGPFRV